MKHIRAQMRQGRKAGIFALLAAACLLLVLPACQNPAQRHGNRTGTVSLTFSQGLERTIMPPTGVAQFDRFELVFTRDVSEVRRVWTYNQLIAGTVELAAGEWFLTVTASRAFVVEDSAEPDGNGDGLEGFRRAAESEAIPVYVALGENTAVPVELNPIAGDGYKGTFRWNISFEYETRIKSAKLVIWEYADREYAVETFDLLNYDTGNYIVLPTGEYWVAVKLGSDSPRVGGGLGKALRVYYNMCSVMEDLEFGNADLSVSPLDLILLAWNGNEWDFSGIEAWEFGALEALSFAIVGVAGVDDGNFDHLEAAFNNVANWSEPFVAPDDAALLMQLVDAALINIGACKGFRGDALLYQPAVWTAIEAMVENETPIDYQWTNDDHTLTVNVGGEDGTAYVVVIDFGRTIPFLPPLTGTVCVTGTLQAGQTLTADTTGLGGSGIIFYQWMRENTVVGTDSTYTVQAADVGSLFTLRVSRAGNSGYITSLPILTGTVGITGMAHVGQTLTANIAELGGTGDIVFQWRRGTTNVGTNSSTYVVQTADTGFAITVTVTRTDNSGSAVSTPTAIVIHPPLTGTVSITGTAHVGQTLTANTGSLGGTGTVSFQWRRGTINLGNNSTYVLQPADVGSSITVTVTRTGNSGSVTSAPTAAVILPPLTGTVSITGNAHVGQTLTANIGSLGGTGTVSFQWRRGTTNIGNDNTYVLQAADVGSTITVTVTRTGNSGSVTSAPTAAVILPPLTGTVSITGNAHVGQTLTANIGSLGGTGTVSFQWRRGTINLGNNSTYVLQPADVGSSITVTVTRTGNSGSVTSTPTAAVILPPLTGTVGITGTLQAGQTLTAVTTGLGGSGAISHQWMRGTTVVGTAATYTVQTADIGSTNFTLRVARANNSGNVTSLPMLAGTVNIIGTAHVGQTLTANIGNLGGSGTAAFQWRRGTINIGINSTYTVQAADVGSTITVTVTRANNSGSVTSVPTAVATWPPPGSVSVTPSSATLVQGVGGTRQFSAAVGPAGAPQAVTWTVSPQPAGVTISSAGLLTVGTGVSVPTLTVRATATGHPAVSGTATVTLTPPPNWIVSAGSYHAVAIREDGRLWAWGSNSSIGMDYGRTGLGMLAGAVFIPFPVGTAANWAYVSAGGRHTVAIRSDGSLWAWGNNRSGQLGDGTTDHPWPGVSNDRGIPVRIGTATNWRSVSAGGDHTVAITTTGELWAWGNNRSGQLGIGTTIYRNIPTRIGTETNWASVSASGNHTIAIRTDGTLWAWGDNSFGQLGDGTIGWFNSSTPTQIGNATNWAYVSTGENHTAAIRGDGSLWAWGNNQWGQLGDGTTTDRNSPVQIGEATNWVSVSAGFNHTVAIRGSGELWVWGGGIYGQLGDGTLTNRTAPVQIERDVTDWVSVSAGNRYTIAVRANRTLWAWGSNLGGRAGHGVISEDVLRPIQVREAAVTVPPPAVSRFAAASAGNGYTLVVGENGTLWAWGNSNNGRTGLGMSEGAPSAPLQVGTATNWSYVSAGNRHTAAIRRDGSLWAWGYNGDGRLGDGTETATWMGAYNDRGSPVRIGTATNWRSVSAGGSHTMAIRTDGTLWAWGGNNRGKLGDGTETNRNIPTRIGNATNWATVSAGYSHTVALRTDGTLWAWGDGFWGQLGDGTNSWSNNTPTQIGNATNWVYVSAGSRHTVAIRRDGTLWAWGHNSFGQLGDGTTADRNTPVQVGEFTNWVSVSAGTNHTMAIREGGTLWAWGQNGSGELGDGTGINRSSPGQIGNESNWASVFASSGDPIFSWGNGHTLAIRTDGTLWVWGSNDSGQLGDGTMTNRLYPFRITIP